MFIFLRFIFYNFPISIIFRGGMVMEDLSTNPEMYTNAYMYYSLCVPFRICLSHFQIKKKQTFFLISSVSFFFQRDA